MGARTRWLRRPEARRAAIGLLCLAVQLMARSGRAELTDDVDRLAAAWKSEATVTRLAPRVMAHSELVPLLLPQRAVRSTGDGCTTVAVLAAMSTSFVLRFLPRPGVAAWRADEAAKSSVGGAVQLVRCGARRAALGRLAVEMRSPRGVVQTVVAGADRGVTPLRRILEHREPGSVAASVPPGPRPAVGPVTDRASLLQARYEQLGAAELVRRLVPAGPDGSARVLFDLDPGCHRFHALGISPDPAVVVGLDIDAEVRWSDSGEVADLDRTDSPDATLSACAGRPRQGVLTFAGGIGGVPIVLLHARWEIPDFLPDRWGPEPRARAYSSFWREHVQPLDEAPFYESLGVGGTTRLPLELEPDACYVATVALLRGQLKVLAAAVEFGASRVFSHTQQADTASLVAFCANGATRAHLDVEAHGTSLAWLAAVWRSSRLPLGRGAE